MSDVEMKTLIDMAIEAREKAYPKLSQYKVGAAIRDTYGNYWTGYNVETDIHHAIHAEMSAIHQMIGAEPRARIVRIAVACADRAWFPCGWCRQWIWEYAMSQVTIVMAHCIKTGETKEMSIGELLPDGFRLTQ